MSKHTDNPCSCSNLNCADLNCGRLDGVTPREEDIDQPLTLTAAGREYLAADTSRVALPETILVNRAALKALLAHADSGGFQSVGLGVRYDQHGDLRSIYGPDCYGPGVNQMYAHTDAALAQVERRLVHTSPPATPRAAFLAAAQMVADMRREIQEARPVTSVEPGCTCGGTAACQQCQERDAVAAVAARVEAVLRPAVSDLTWTPPLSLIRDIRAALYGGGHDAVGAQGDAPADGPQMPEPEAATVVALARLQVKHAVEEWFSDVSLDDLFTAKGWNA